MLKIARLIFPTLALACATMAQAAPVSLGVAGDFNFVSLGDFKAPSSDVEGAVAVAGNMSVGSYTVNLHNRSVDGYGLVVGNNLRFHGGDVVHGDAWVGGTRDVQNFGFGGQWRSGPEPLSFTQIAADMQALSQGLALVAPTGSVEAKWSGLFLNGSNSGADIFSLNTADLGAATWSSLSGLQQGATVILNIAGTSGLLTGGFPNALDGYNVLYNFFEATTLDIRNVGVYGSILAPFATVTGGSGQINGNVIVANWDSQVQVNANRYFVDTDIPGYTPPALPARPADVQAVPEPGSLALVGLALCAMVVVAGRRRQGRDTGTQTLPPALAG